MTNNTTSDNNQAGSGKVVYLSHYWMQLLLVVLAGYVFYYLLGFSSWEEIRSSSVHLFSALFVVALFVARLGTLFYQILFRVHRVEVDANELRLGSIRSTKHYPRNTLTNLEVQTIEVRSHIDGRYKLFLVSFNDSEGKPVRFSVMKKKGQQVIDALAL